MPIDPDLSGFFPPMVILVTPSTILSFNLNPPPLVEDPERFDRSGVFL
jgi:hypothetical protein